MKRFHGFPYPRIGIDIFPLDAVAANSASLYLQKSMVELTMNLLTHWDDYPFYDIQEAELQSIFEQESITCTITEFCRKVSVLFDYL